MTPNVPPNCVVAAVGEPKSNASACVVETVVEAGNKAADETLPTGALTGIVETSLPNESKVSVAISVALTAAFAAVGTVVMGVKVTILPTIVLIVSEPGLPAIMIPEPTDKPATEAKVAVLAPTIVAAAVVEETAGTVAPSTVKKVFQPEDGALVVIAALATVVVTVAGVKVTVPAGAAPTAIPEIVTINAAPAAPAPGIVIVLPIASPATEGSATVVAGAVITGTVAAGIAIG